MQGDEALCCNFNILPSTLMKEASLLDISWLIVLVEFQLFYYPFLLFI